LRCGTQEAAPCIYIPISQTLTTHMFIDHVKIYVKAGDGGDGCLSFHHDRFHRHPVPDGGHGGKGGDVIMRADGNVTTLLDFHYQQHIAAERGGHGGSNNKKGRSGQDLIVRVPCGTILYDAKDNLIMRDLVDIGDEVVVAKGGFGGRGNSGGKLATKGRQGEPRELALELKLIADVGIVGYPNAGKSTLLSKISSARPKIAGYPFTTKEPVLGVVKLYADGSPFVVADIPGLIEGAHAGKGLGDKFLRHVERTRILIHLVDISALEGRDPYIDYAKVNEELRLYSKELSKRPQILALNKTDLPTSKDNIKAFRSRVRKKAYPISALNGDGLGELLKEVYKKLKGLER